VRWVAGAAARLGNKRAGGPNSTISRRMKTGLTLFESGNEIDSREINQSESNKHNLMLVVVFK
jgi:hypothetical protein